MKKEDLIKMGLTEEVADSIIKAAEESTNKAVESRLARAKKEQDAVVKELERKHGETIEDYEMRIKTANMTAEEKYKLEIENANKKLAETEKKLKDTEIQSLRKSVLAKHKLPDKFINRIYGESEEDIEKSVAELTDAMSEYWKSQAGGTPTDLNGGAKLAGNEKDDAVLKAFDDEMKKF